MKSDRAVDRAWTDEVRLEREVAAARGVKPQPVPDDADWELFDPWALGTRLAILLVCFLIGVAMGIFILPFILPAFLL